jgi:hypothetical protein
VKAQVNRAGRPEIYYFRDEQGLEVDFLVPGRGGSVWLVECKSGKTVTPAMAAPMQRLADSLAKKRPRGTPAKMFLVHQEPSRPTPIRAVAPGVKALAWRDFVGTL